ncbi:MAG: DUF4911 domain-containing protein [Peptococcaceae bacterium]|nr:DUF4911 domain-containing protein [Peptococcaceae bacterium]
MKKMAAFGELRKDSGGVKARNPADSLTVYFFARQERIAFITKIFESIGHLAMVSTVDKTAGRLRALCTPEAEAQVLRLLQELDCRPEENGESSR